jgi:hypothetical protein
MSERIGFDTYRADGLCSQSSGRRYMNVRIGYSTGPGILSRLIRFCTGGLVSHSFAVFYDPAFDQDMVLEADWNGVVVKTLAKAKRERTIVAILKPPAPIDAGLKAAADWLDARYDYSGLLGMIFVLAWRRLGRRLKNPFHSSHALFCSDAMALLMQKGGYQSAESLDPACCDPPALMQWQLDTGSTDVTSLAA